MAKGREMALHTGNFLLITLGMQAKQRRDNMMAFHRPAPFICGIS